MDVARVLHMSAGSGENSYAKNSAFQSKIIAMVKPVVVEAMQKLLRRSLPEIMGMADLGCSSGQNTLNVVSEVMDVVYEKYRGYGRSLPELNVFLNDLYSNDFNQVFQMLPVFLHKIKTEKGDEFARKCAIFGAPGSFHGRLFPSKSLHFVHSSSSLHWLSRVPPCLDKEGKEAMNKGEIHISKKTPPCVLKAYAEQFHEDFSMLLKSRSEEMVEGGRMVLSFMGRKSTEHTESGYQWEILWEALMSMVPEALIEEEKVDSFNLPCYAPCKDELEVEIEREGSFILDRYQAFEVYWDGASVGDRMGDGDFATPPSGRLAANTMRAGSESMLEFHFGGEIMDELFKRYEKKFNDHFWKTRAKLINLVISLVRK